MGALFSSNGIINTVNAQSNFVVRIWEWLTKLSHKYSENGLDRQKRADVLAGKLKSIVERTYGSQEKLTAKKAEVEAKAKEEADEKKKQKEADKATAKAAREAQKSTESDESTEGEQTGTEADLAANRAENNGEIYNRAEEDAKFIDNLIEIGYTENEAKKFKRYGVDSYDNQRENAEEFATQNGVRHEAEGPRRGGHTLAKNYVAKSGRESAIHGQREISNIDAVANNRSGETNENGLRGVSGNKFSISTETDVNIDTEIVDLYSQKDYNNFGWARVNGVLSADENANFKKRFSEDKKKYRKTPNGEYMIPVNDNKNGADNVIVFAKGSFDNPIITQVVRIDINNDTECYYIREDLINELEKGSRYDTVRLDIEKYYGEGLLNKNTRDDCPSLREIRQANNTGRGSTDNRGISVGEGSNTDASSKIPGTEEVKHSVSIADDADYISADLASEAEWTYNIPEPKYDVLTDVAATEFSPEKALRGVEKAKQEYNVNDDEAAALQVYVEGGAYNLTRTQRKNDRSEQSEYDAYIEKLVFDGLLKHPTYSGITYRNFDFDTVFNSKEEYDTFLKEHVEGKVVDLEAFTSASKVPNGYTVTGNKVVHLVIKGESARDISETFNEDQQEVIYLPGSKYLVVRVTTANDGNPLIYGKEITNNEVQQLQRSSFGPQSGRGVQTVFEGQEYDARGISRNGGIQGSENISNEKQGKNAVQIQSNRRSEGQAEGVKHSVSIADDAETSSQDYLEMIAETKAKKESNATLVEKLLNERGTRIDGTSVPEFLKNLIASYESEAWYGNVEKKYHELFDKVYSGKGENIDVKTVTDMFRDIATDIFNSAFEYKKSLQELLEGFDFISSALTDRRLRG